MLDLNKYGITMWGDTKIKSFRHILLTWYDNSKRDLPWRHTLDPYHIWVSEIMLQQTQVVTVIPYYQRFLALFPTISDLANAPEEKLLKAWEGLGYYSRVKNMQKAAHQIMTDFNGKFPNNHSDILKLTGIGPYTAGAIASISFGLPEPAVDGNVMRVMARLFEVNYDIGDPKNRKIFQAIMEILIDPKRPGDFNQALMDLGSDIESAKTPHPEDSPVKFFSGAYLNGTMDKYPIKKPKKKPRPLEFQAFIIQNHQGKFLLEKNEEKGLLSGFWTFPLIENTQVEQLNLFDDKTTSPARQTQSKLFEQKYNLTPTWSKKTFNNIKHTFSHQKWSIELVFGKIDSKEFLKQQNLAWIDPKDFDKYPFATPQKKMWSTFQNDVENDNK